MRTYRTLNLATAAGFLVFGLLFAASATADTLLGPDDFESGFGNWTNATGDVFDWTRNSGGTPSSNTGPSGDHTTGSGYYLFTEASSPRGAGDDAILESPCIDLTGASAADLDFWYHMYGAGMGTLDVQVASSTGASCASLGSYASAFSLSGDQGNAWYAANVSLDPYTGGSIQIQIIGVIGSSYQSDIAIDDVEVTATLGPECEFNEDCDDLNDCTDDVCNAGTCEYTNSASPCDFRFGMMVDPRDFSGPDHDTVDYLRGACEAMDALGSGDFLIAPGDIDHPPEPPGSPADVYWTIEKYLGSGFLWYPGVGNHETETSSDMAWLRALNPGGNTLPYVVNVGPGGPGPSGSEETTYSFDYGDVHFVQINEYYDGSSDTGTNGDVTDALYNWLQADLTATTQPLIFVLGHEPAWPQPDADNGSIRHLGDSLDEHASNRDRFWSLLRQHEVDAYICGHSHTFSAVNIDGIWQLDLGHARGIGETGAMSTFALTDIVDDTVTYQAYRGSGAGASSYSLMHSDLIACDGCDTYLFQDGVFPSVAYSGTRDTYIESGSVHGGNTPLLVDGSPDVSAILEWDVSAVPMGATVLRAWITLNVQDKSDASYEIYEMKRDWVESEANWSDYASGGSWQVAGASGANDRGSTVLGEVTARSDYSNNYILSLNGDGVALLQSWIDSPAANHGVIITDYSESDSVTFDSRENGSAEYRPKLTIWYQNALEVCGDDNVDPGEDCDDGNTLPGDCCSPTCQFESVATECRAAAGVCDAADYCDGAGACDADAKLTSECRASAGVCDVAEVCDGVADDCPVDIYEPATTECRASAGVCDAAEMCTGSGASCPADAFEPATTECRAAAGACDAADYCDGASATCTADVKLTSECRASAGACDVAEVCDGVADDCPADAFEPATTECRASAGDCDIAETCPGTGPACPADGFEPLGTACGDPGDTVCDDPDSCDAVGSCQANYEPPTTLCRAAVDVCDAPDYCDGASAACPADEKLTTECRPSEHVCDAAEMCNGVWDDCGRDMPANGLPCPDGDLCNGDEVCVSWTCTAGPPCDCDDGDSCTIDICDAVQGCVYEPIVGGPSGCGMLDLPSASPAGRLLLSLLVVGAGATFLAWRRHSPERKWGGRARRRIHPQILLKS